MSEGMPESLRDGCLLLVVSLGGPEPPDEPTLLVEKETVQGTLSIAHRPDGTLEACFAYRRPSAGVERVAAVSCRLVAEAGSLCVAEVKWQAPDYLELCLNGTLVASTDPQRSLPVVYTLGSC